MINWAGPEPLWATEDKYTILWDELVAASEKIAASEYDDGKYDGLLRAYALLTGDSESEVDRQVGAAARVARSHLEPVPS